MKERLRNIRVLFDVTYIQDERSLHSSVSIWLLRVIGAIPKEERNNFHLLVSPKMKEFIRLNYPDYYVLECDLKGAMFPSLSFLSYLITSFKLKKIINAYGYDCLFGGSAVNYLWFKHSVKSIVVEHDMKSLKKDVGVGRISRFFSYRTTLKYFSYVDAIMAISEYTKKDILEVFPNVNPQKIYVVHNSVSLSEIENKPQNAPEKGYLLYVNTLQKYKNVFTLIKAYNIIKDKINLPLVLVGKGTDYWNFQVMPYIREEGFENRIIQMENLTESELHFLYGHATLFVTPSTHEGFGYTPIEAAICNCPVISSTCESLPETTMGLLNYYEPATDAEVLAKKILDVLKDKPSKERLAVIAQEFKRKYSPKNQIEKIISLINTICNK